MNEIVMIPIDMLHPHPDNPRKDLGDLAELAASIRESGLLQNLTVVEGSYMTEEEWNAEQKELLDVPGEVGHHKNYAYGDQAEYQRCAELDEVYRMLEMLGYEKDDEELRMDDPQDEMFDLNHFAKLRDEQTARGGTPT